MPATLGTANPAIRTLLLCDLVASTRLVERVGDSTAADLSFQAGMPELRNDPRFARLCARLGLVEFWMATGKWPDCASEVPYGFKAECAKARHIPKEDLGF